MEQEITTPLGGTDMVKVIIATLHSLEPIMKSAMKFPVDRFYFLVDKDPDKTTKDTIEQLKVTLKDAVELKFIKVETYDPVDVATQTVKIIDVLGASDEILINVSSGRKPMALGLIYGAYARISKIKNIFYIVHETNKLIYLPKLGFDVSDKQKEIMEILDKNPNMSLNDLSTKVDLSRGMVYRHIDELRSKNLIIEESGYKLTDAGRICLL